MGFTKKRIGLVLASIHTGASLNVWPCFVRTSYTKNTSLFIFPGGRLNAPQDSENLRNPVYSLVNPENLDGLISWSSTIHYTETKEEFELFHSGFDPLPYVTLAYKIPGHPCVEFDAYNGIKALVGHCIRVHGARNIAFLRGPDFHQSALARFQGYQDALRESGLPVPLQSPLVTDPFNWNNGDAAAAQLFEDRSLIPGRDFDTLIGSSDLMVFGAVYYFLKAGYHVPRDYRAGGFNNSIESKVLESPLSTVHIPYTELSSESFRIILKLLGKKNPDITDVQLASELVIRESCGCDYRVPRALKNTPGDSGHNGKGEDTARDAIARMAADYLNLEPGYAADLLSPLTDALFGGREEVFFHLFEKALIRFFNSGRDIERFLKFLGDISLSGIFPPDMLIRIEPALYRIVFRIRERLTTHEQYEKEKWNTVLNSLKCELLGARDRGFLIQSLARHLPQIGIATVAIVLFEDDKISCCVGGFSPQGISPPREQRFPARLLVPADLKGQYADGVFMVQPLFIENQSLGYFVHNVPVYDGVIFEELRSAVSYALKGIFLLEELVRAQRTAKKAEQAKSEFLTALKNALRSPERRIVLIIGAPENREYPWPGEDGDIQRTSFSIDSLESFDETVAEISPSLIVINGMNHEAAELVRRHPLTSAVPIVMIGGRIDSAAGVTALSGYSRLLICNSAAASAPEFLSRIKALIGGDEILPSHTGALVKKTILYFNTNVASPISRWKLAEAVNVSEDYLTRIFHREMGMSLWDYLNRYRVFLAAALLRRTDETIKEIAFQCGFQDQAYFCRVFKKIRGCSPGQLRKRSE